MEVISIAMLAALVVKLVSVIKSIGKDNNYVLTQVVAWLAGVLVVWVASEAEVTENLVMLGQTLGDMDVGSIVLAGLALASGGSFAYDFKAAFDSTDSASEPSLLPAPSSNNPTT